VYTLRGAQVRDALAWSEQIQESIERYGDRLEVQFASHHWPIWGRAEALAYLEAQRDLYKYIHDQVLRLANHGFNPEEIAEQIRLPDSLDHNFSNRGYYGTVHHNARAVYVKYLGFFDGNPANIHRLPPSEAGRRYVSFMGGADQLVARARESFEDGDYRWVAEVLNHLVMSEPEHADARALLADTLEQLGYQSESAVWRNFYLCGALELRAPVTSTTSYAPSPGTALRIPLDNVFKAMAVRLNGPRAAEVSLRFNLQFTDLDQPYLLSIENGVLHAFPERSSAEANATLELTSQDFKRLMMGMTDGATLAADGLLTVQGDGEALLQLTTLFDQFERRYPIVTPRTVPDQA
jgi:alkyl sulfatase BDS1-like metallo-beta-lactamase superfamily hydrolase